MTGVQVLAAANRRVGRQALVAGHYMIVLFVCLALGVFVAQRLGRRPS